MYRSFKPADKSLSSRSTDADLRGSKAVVSASPVSPCLCPRMAGHQLQDDYRDQFKGLENMDSSVMTAFKVSTQRQAAAPPSRKDKSDRATVEQALDPRTRMVCVCMSKVSVSVDLQNA